MTGGRILTVRSRIQIHDGHGGHLSSFTEMQERGRMRPATARERSTGGQNTPGVQYVAYLRAEAVIANSDQIRVGDNFYDVLAVRNPGFADCHLEVDLKDA